ncbi:MAG TPA: hypothetical protein VFC42_11620 [Methylomirabilota bacterium]|nr:hypothetical protein [Methylomirabilota bacterium]
MPGGRRGAAARATFRLAVALGLGACAAVPPTPTPAPPAPGGSAQVSDILRGWANEWDAFQGLRAAVDLTVTNRRGTRRVSAVLLLSRTSLRIEVATPFGLPAVVGTAGPEGVTVFRVLEREAQVGAATPEVVAHWLGVPLPPEMLIRLLVGNVPPPEPEAAALEAAAPPRLAWSSGAARYQAWVGPEGHPTRLVVDSEGQERLQAEFERAATGELLGLRLAAPARRGEVTLRYLSVEPGPVPPEAFQLALPADVRVQPID